MIQSSMAWAANSVLREDMFVSEPPIQVLLSNPSQSFKLTLKLAHGSLT